MNRENGPLDSVNRLISRINSEGKKPSTVVFQRGYSLMLVISALHAEYICVMGTARD